jgi:hypothetical protein
MYPHEKRSLEIRGLSPADYTALDLVASRAQIEGIDEHGNVIFNLRVLVPANVLDGFAKVGLIVGADGRSRPPEIGKKFAFSPAVRFVLATDALTQVAQSQLSQSIEYQRIATQRAQAEASPAGVPVAPTPEPPPVG